MIYRQIRLISLQRLIYAVIMLITTCYIFYRIPFFDVLWPAQIHDPSTIIELYQNDITCVELTADTLYYSGYDYMQNGKITGSYYYNLYDGICIYFLLPSSQCNNRQEILNNVQIKARLQSGGKLLSEVIQEMAADLNWTAQGLSSVSSRIIINAIDYLLLKNMIFLAICLIVLVTSLLVFFNVLSYLLCPLLHPSCFRLRRYGSVREQIREAEQELCLEPILQKGIFTITPHYLIASSHIQLYILPLDQIIWIYKHSNLHRFRFRHLRITYTLRITARKRLHMVASVQPKEDVDAVIEYLAQYNPDILLHYSRENEQLAKLRSRL